jgi:hypothetical protein
MAYVIAEQRQQFGSIVEASVPAENVPVTRNQRLSIESRFTIRVKRAVYKTDRSAGHRIAAVWTMTLQLGAERDQRSFVHRLVVEVVNSA